MSVSVYRNGFNGKTGLHDLYYGALRFSGRWHTPIPGASSAVVYSASSRALAQLEKRVHCNGIMPVDQALLRLDIREGAMLLHAVDDLKLRDDWKLNEVYAQRFGNEWFQSKASLGLWVPSYVVTREFNILLNPSHPMYDSHVKVEVEERDFRFDTRIF